VFKPPSLQKEFVLVYSGDPALELPVVPDKVDGETEEAAKQREELAAEVESKLRVASETGRWGEIVKSGQIPTFFHFRSIHDDALMWLLGEVTRRQLTEIESCELAFRLALVKIENFGTLRVEHEQIDDQKLAKKKSIRALYDIGCELDPPQAIGRTIVLQLGAQVIKRAREGALPPKR
jgi:hypothetical protein